MAPVSARLRQFDYLAVDRHGKQHRGRISSRSVALARVQLRQQGMVQLIHLRQHRQRLFEFHTPIKTADITALTRQLATLVQAGVPLVRAFDILIEGLTNKRLADRVRQIRVDVAGGNTFAAALRQHPRYFGSLYCALIEVGESAGTVDTMLERLAQHLEKTEQLHKKIRAALAYPTVVLIIATVITVLLLVKVVPTFAELFASFGAPLPTATVMIVELSQSLRAHWLSLVLLTVATGSCVRTMMRRSPRTRQSWQRLTLKLPVIGPVLRHAALARYARTLSITFAAGVPLVQALQSAAKASAVDHQAIEDTAKAVATGTELAIAMRQHPCFPSLMIQLVAVGEQSGTLDSMLAKAATIYEDAVDQKVAALTSIMEPLIMTVLGLLVGGLVVSMYLPIFRMGAVIG